MRTRPILFIMILIILATSLSGCGILRKLFGRSGQTDYPYFCSAKKWFSYVEYKAKLWRPDAVFYGTGDTEANLDGEARKWEYLFDSPEANKQATITLQGGFISLREEGRIALTSVKNWEIDSTAAMLKAQEAGGREFLLRNPNAKIFISLITELPNSRKKQTAWFVKFQGTASMYYILIDVRNGGVISSQEVNFS